MPQRNWQQHERARKARYIRGTCTPWASTGSRREASTRNNSRNGKLSGNDTMSLRYRPHPNTFAVYARKTDRQHLDDNSTRCQADRRAGHVFTCTSTSMSAKRSSRVSLALEGNKPWPCHPCARTLAWCGHNGWGRLRSHALRIVQLNSPSVRDIFTRPIRAADLTLTAGMGGCRLPAVCPNAWAPQQWRH